MSKDNLTIEAVDKKPALWTRNFTTCAAANFLLFFSFYQLLPILPMFIIEKFQTDNATAGIVISLYTIGALACRPFAGFLVDTLSRKPLYFWTFFAFTLCFIGYKTLGLIPLLAVLRFMHGLCFGISTTASNTVAIDALPASRRGEGIGYFGISVNLAFATGPMTGMFLYEAFGDNIVFAISIILCVIGLILVKASCAAFARQVLPHARRPTICELHLRRFRLRARHELHRALCEGTRHLRFRMVLCAHRRRAHHQPCYDRAPD